MDIERDREEGRQTKRIMQRDTAEEAERQREGSINQFCLMGEDTQDRHPQLLSQTQAEITRIASS